MKHAVCLLAVVLTALSTGPLAFQQPTPGEPTYRVGAADELKVTVFDEAALSGSFRVDIDGSIAHPLLGRVAVQGKTVREIEQHLTERLLAGYVRRPQVSVEVMQFRSRSVFITGEVRTPGKYALDGDVTLLEVLALAGAVTDSAGDEISVRRSNAPQPAAGPSLPEDPQSVEVLRVSLLDLQGGRTSSNLVLHDGDTIFVPTAPRVFVTGHVRSPGAVVLRGRLTVQQAIALAGGLTDRGSTRRIQIRREEAPGKFKEVRVRMTDYVQANDTIIVPQRLI